MRPSRSLRPSRAGGQAVIALSVSRRRPLSAQAPGARRPSGAAKEKERAQNKSVSRHHLGAGGGTSVDRQVRRHGRSSLSIALCCAGYRNFTSRTRRLWPLNAQRGASAHRRRQTAPPADRYPPRPRSHARPSAPAAPHGRGRRGPPVPERRRNGKFQAAHEAEIEAVFQQSHPSPSSAPSGERPVSSVISRRAEPRRSRRPSLTSSGSGVPPAK